MLIDRPFFRAHKKAVTNSALVHFSQDYGCKENKTSLFTALQKILWFAKITCFNIKRGIKGFVNVAKISFRANCAADFAKSAKFLRLVWRTISKEISVFGHQGCNFLIIFQANCVSAQFLLV